MPIGTQSTAILLKQYQPQITRKPRSENETNFWWLFFETILITVAATVAGAVTGGVASGVVLSIGASDFAAGITSFATRVLVEFAINQSIDAARDQISARNTALNLLLPIAFNANQITRGYRTTKILRLARETKTLEKLGVEDARNIKDLIDRLSNMQLLTKEINGKKQLFNFGKLNREQVLQNIGFVTQETFKYEFQNLTANEIKQNLLLQVNLAKLSPRLLPKLKIQNLENVNNYLAKFGTNYETVIKMNHFDWLHLISEIQSTNSGKSLVLALQQIRNNTVKFNFNSRIITNSLNKINRSFKYFNVNYYINKGLEKFWENTPYLSVLKEKILILQQKIEVIENKAISKIDNLLKKGKEIFTRGEKVAIQQFNLIPLNSPVFLACKIEPLTLGNAAITIFYKDTRYDPIVVTDTIAKAETFVSQEHPFSWYWNESGWPLGYGINKNSVLSLVNLIPSAARKIAQEGLKINFQIRKIKQRIDAIEKHEFFNIDIKRTLINTPINFVLRKGLNNRSTRFLVPLINQKINQRKINTRRTIINRSSSYIKRKARKRVIRRW